MTNEEKLRQDIQKMNREDFVILITDGYEEKCPYCIYDEEDCQGRNCKEGHELWLDLEAKEDGN